MKKLMIAAAIVCAAVVSQAAVANWSVSDIYDWTDINKAEPGYDVMGANYATYMVVATSDFGRDELIAALGEGKFSWMTEQKVDTPTAAMAGGAASGTTPAWFGNEETVNAFAVVFNNADYASADYAYVTPIASDTTGAEGQAASLKFTGEDSWDPSLWTAVGDAPSPTPTPEPTSGLLLLLGVAGLALRRRRA